jgi:starch synthase
LQRLAADPALRQRLGQAGWERVREVYDWTKKGEAIQSIYQSIVDARRFMP